MIYPREIVWIGECCFPAPADRNGDTRRSYQEPRVRGDYLGVKINGQNWPAHRLSYCLNVEEIPRAPENRKEGLVLHTCDNKWCINPEHLYLGTSSQNAKDNARRNKVWLQKRREIQKEKGFPAVSAEGRKRMAESNSERLKELHAKDPRWSKELCQKMREAKQA